MPLNQYKRAVGVFTNRQDAEYALNELRDSGFFMDAVSVVVRDADQKDNIAGAEVQKQVGNKSDEGAVTGVVAGGALGGLAGLLVGLGTLAIPGVGPVMLAGATATLIATTISGGAIGAISGSIIGALIGLGIPEARARVYNERVVRGEYLVIIDGTIDNIALATTILMSRGIEELGIYDIPESKPVNKYALGYFANLQDAEAAIVSLRNANFPLNQISLIAQHFEQPELFRGVELYGRLDAMKCGLPEEHTRFYSDGITRGDCVVVVNGTEEEIHRAALILNNRGIQKWSVFDANVLETPRGEYLTSEIPAANYDTDTRPRARVVDHHREQIL